MSKFCNVCGTSLKEGAKFCITCGSPVKSANSQFTYDDSTEGTVINITAESLFTTVANDISNLFSYNKLGREFTGDISYIRKNLDLHINTVPADSLNKIADSNMISIRQRFSKINDNMTDENWQNVHDFLKNGIPLMIVAYFYNPHLAVEVREMMEKMKTLSKNRWEKTSIFGKAAVPSAKFEDFYTLRYVVNNLKF